MKKCKQLIQLLFGSVNTEFVKWHKKKNPIFVFAKINTLLLYTFYAF